MTKKLRLSFPLYDVEITWRKDSRCMRIFAPDDKLLVRMTVPHLLGEAEVLRFLQSREKWLAGQTPGVPGWRPAFVEGERHLLFGRYVPLGGGELPAGARPLRAVREKLAMETLSQILPSVMQLLRLPMPHIKLHHARRMPGVCYPGKNLISFDWRLSCYPMPVVTCLAVHEACHLVHPHHGEMFHRLVDALISPGRERAIRRAMSSYVPMPLPGIGPGADLGWPVPGALLQPLVLASQPPDSALLRPTRLERT